MVISPQIHLLMVAYVLAIIAGSVVSGSLAKRRGRLAENRRLQAWFMVSLWTGYNGYYFHPENFTWQTSLPLHVCDLLGPCSAIAIGWGRRGARVVLYYCALTLAGQAVITPAGNQDPATLRFWLYWTLHAGILAFSALDLIVLNFRPVPRDYLTILLIDILYALVIVPINVAFGWNYGYLGNRVPDTLTAISLFGPWPGRIPVMLLAVFAIQGLLHLPWLFITPRKTGSNDTEEAAQNA